VKLPFEWTYHEELLHAALMDAARLLGVEAA
jgi:hypothetical protein